MRIRRNSPHSSVARRIRLTAVVSGLIAATALAVPAANAEPPAPTYSAEQLSAVNNAVRAADVAGTAWHIDVKNNKLVVAADSTVSRADLASIKKRAGTNAGAIRVERIPGKLRKLISGGDAVYATSWRCSLGFNVRSGTTYYFLTAGHCTDGAGTWYANSGRTTVLGPTAGSSFPGNDYGIVRYSNTSISHPGTVGSQDITSAGNPTVNQSACRRGSTTGIHCGTVTGLNYTVNYGGGDIVYGLIRTNICAEPGDSGGPLYSGSKALGLTSGGSGDCTSGGTTFFQPVTEALSAYGVSVY